MIWRFTCLLSLELKGRLERITKRLRTSSSDLARQAIHEKVEYWEKRFAELDAETRRLKEERQAGRRSLFIAKAPADSQKSVEHENEELVDEVYFRCAATIARVTDPIEKRILMLESVKEIQKKFPLTHPSEIKIQERLQRIVELAQAANNVVVEEKKANVFGDT